MFLEKIIMFCFVILSPEGDPLGRSEESLQFEDSSAMP